MDNFEDFLKEEAKGFEMEPSGRVWNAVEGAITKPKRLLYWWYGAAGLVFCISATIGYYYLSSGNTNKMKYSKNAVIEKPITENSNDENKRGKTDVITKEQDHNNAIAGSSTTKKQEPVYVGHKENNNKPGTNSIQEVATKTEKKQASADHLYSGLTIVQIQQKQYIPLQPAITKDFKNIAQRNHEINKHKEADAGTFSFMFTAGLNVSNPLKINYRNYVKPALGFSILFTTRYKITRSFSASAGFGFQENRYKIGAVAIYPETIYLSTPNGLVAQTAKYKLNNETLHNNLTQQIIVPLALGYNFHLSAQKSIVFLGGIDFAKNIAPHYLIKSETNDRLFSNDGIINHFNTYITSGLEYHQKINKKSEWICSYKIQYLPVRHKK